NPGTNGANGAGSAYAAAITHTPPSAPSIARAREISAPQRLVEPMFDQMSSFGSGMLGARPKSKNQNMLYIAAGGAVIAVIAVIVIVATTGGKKSSPGAAEPNAVAAGSAGSAMVAPSGTQAIAPTDPNTGFDLYVSPGGVT